MAVAGCLAGQRDRSTAFSLADQRLKTLEPKRPTELPGLGNRGSITEGSVWSHGVGMPSQSLDEHPRLEECVEDLPLHSFAQ